jgi:hypothetical protein
MVKIVGRFHTYLFITIMAIFFVNSRNKKGPYQLMEGPFTAYDYLYFYYNPVVVSILVVSVVVVVSVELDV